MEYFYSFILLRYKVRKDRSLRLEDLADDHISVVTISNIERGVSHVKFDKVNYLLKKLSLEIKDLPEILLDNELELREIQLFILQQNYCYWEWDFKIKFKFITLLTQNA